MTANNFDPSDPDKMRLPTGKSCGDCVHIRRCKAIFGQFDEWIQNNGMDWGITELETDPSAEADAIRDRYFEAGDLNVSDWNPTPPAGDGWFVGSIHDTEDGPVCIWLRENA
ncbi:hypothetical protein ACIPSX_12545 [Pectobacterium sp. CHL-2024]|uniref:hypothetical protein n=1 Tax=Pectobacterium sp. CHL-2024 TaxID=3377079 RepID=UPI003823D65B